MNGLEIDLAELELFEKRLADKRKSVPNASAVANETSNSPDEIDMYLDRLAIDINARNDAKHVNDASSAASMPSTSSAQHDDTTVATQCSMVATSDKCPVNGIDSTTPLAALTVPQTSLPLLLYGLMSILVFINSVCYSKRGTQPCNRVAEHFANLL